MNYKQENQREMEYISQYACYKKNYAEIEYWIHLIFLDI